MIFGEYRRSEKPGFAGGLIGLSESGALTRHIPADAARRWQDDRAALIQHTVWNTVESKSDHGPLCDVDAQLAVCAWARIDNREELAPHLGLSAGDARIPDIRFILAAYRKWGEQCVERLLGDFAFAVWDMRRQTLFCARDPMGVRPFYYRLDADHFLFAGTLKVFVDLPGLRLEPIQEWMAEYLTGISMSFHRTPYQGILKLPPGHCLRVTASNHELRQYHRLNGETTLFLRNGGEYVEAYREQLERAVRCRLRSAYPMGSELSGGIDSSTLTVFASKFLPDAALQLHAFAFSRLEMEPEYIEAVSGSFPMAATHVFSNARLAPEDLSAHQARTLNILGYPEEHANGSGHDPFYRKAEQLGVRTLLSGFGGDEFVTNPGSMAVTEFQHRKQYLQLYGNLEGNPLVRALRSAKRILLPRPGPERNPRFVKAFEERWPHQPVKARYVEAFDLHRRYMQGTRYDAGWRSLNEFVLNNRWAPFVPTRMENCTLMAAARKIEYRWPLLDVRLVQLFLSIPAGQKYHKGVGRLLHRKAIDGLVPHKVAWKQGKCMGDPLAESEAFPAGVSSPDALHPLLAELVDEAKLAALRAYPPDGKSVSFALNRNRARIACLDRWLAQVTEREPRTSSAAGSPSSPSDARFCPLSTTANSAA